MDLCPQFMVAVDMMFVLCGYKQTKQLCFGKKVLNFTHSCPEFYCVSLLKCRRRGDVLWINCDLRTWGLAVAQILCEYLNFF